MQEIYQELREISQKLKVSTWLSNAGNSSSGSLPSHEFNPQKKHSVIVLVCLPVWAN